VDDRAIGLGDYLQRGEPGEHTLELPSELEGKGDAIEAVVRILLSSGAKNGAKN
jgi:hypothetical protein